MKVKLLSIAILTVVSVVGCAKPLKLQKTQVSVAPIGHVAQPTSTYQGQ